MPGDLKCSHASQRLIMNACSSCLETDASSWAHATSHRKAPLESRAIPPRALAPHTHLMTAAARTRNYITLTANFDSRRSQFCHFRHFVPQPKRQVTIPEGSAPLKLQGGPPSPWVHRGRKIKPSHQNKGDAKTLAGGPADGY
jgi:hypothetical protein